MDTLAYSTKFEPGDHVPGPDNSLYKIIKWLGRGTTAEVYLAERVGDGQPAALKMLLPSLPQATVDAFWNELLILRELDGAGIPYVPKVLGFQGRTPGDPHPFYIALEYIDPALYQPVDVLTAGWPLLEVQALELAAQGLDMLGQLFDQVRRGLTDMQLKNFCWEWNESAPHLKVLDWNYISPKQEDLDKNPQEQARLKATPMGAASFEQLKAANLAYFGAYFYRMLTGKDAREKGEPERILEERAGETWGKISLAARLAVLKALHPNPERRFQSVDEFLKAVREVQALWTCEKSVLVEEFTQANNLKRDLQENDKGRSIKVALDGASDETVRQVILERSRDLDQLDRARAVADMVQRRGFWDPNRVEALIRELDEIAQGVSGEWARGQNYFDARLWIDAAQVWKREAIARGKVRLHRWSLLASALASLSKDQALRIQPPLLNALEQMEAGAPGEAAALFTEAMSLLSPADPKAAPNFPDEIRALALEAQVAEQVLQADRQARSAEMEHWKSALEKYKAAEKGLASISFTAFVETLKDEKGWNLLARRQEELRQRISAQEGAGLAIGSIESAFQADFEQGLNTLTNELYLAPAAPVLIDFAFEKLDRLIALQLDKKNPDQVIIGLEQARKIAVILLRWARLPELRAKALHQRLSDLEKRLDKTCLARDHKETFRQLEREIRSAFSVAPVNGTSIGAQPAMDGVAPSVELRLWKDIPGLASQVPSDQLDSEEAQALVRDLQSQFDSQIKLKSLENAVYIDQALIALANDNLQRASQLAELRSKMEAALLKDQATDATHQMLQLRSDENEFLQKYNSRLIDILGRLWTADTQTLPSLKKELEQLLVDSARARDVSDSLIRSDVAESWLADLRGQLENFATLGQRIHAWQVDQDKFLLVPQLLVEGWILLGELKPDAYTLAMQKLSQAQSLLGQFPGGANNDLFFQKQCQAALLLADGIKNQQIIESLGQAWDHLRCVQRMLDELSDGYKPGHQMDDQVLERAAAISPDDILRNLKSARQKYIDAMQKYWAQLRPVLPVIQDESLRGSLSAGLDSFYREYMAYWRSLSRNPFLKAYFEKKLESLELPLPGDASSGPSSAGSAPDSASSQPVKGRQGWYIAALVLVLALVGGLGLGIVIDRILLGASTGIANLPPTTQVVANVTETLVITQVPAATELLAATAAPVATAVPTATAAPIVTEVPTATPAPVATATQGSETAMMDLGIQPLPELLYLPPAGSAGPDEPSNVFDLPPIQITSGESWTFQTDGQSLWVVDAAQKRYALDTGLYPGLLQPGQALPNNEALQDQTLLPYSEPALQSLMRDTPNLTTVDFASILLPNGAGTVKPLEPGDYTLVLRALAPDGQEPLAEERLYFKVVPPNQEFNHYVNDKLDRGFFDYLFSGGQWKMIYNRAPGSQPGSLPFDIFGQVKDPDASDKYFIRGRELDTRKLTWVASGYISSKAAFGETTDKIKALASIPLPAEPPAPAPVATTAPVQPKATPTPPRSSGGRTD